jgi:signal transduction histidine kinase
VAADKLKAEVADTGVGFTPGAGSGVGLANIRERLRLLYDGCASLAIEPNQPTGTRAVIEIPLDAAKTTDASRS